MAGTFERTYGKLFKYMTIAINPIKKVVKDTPCDIHKFINFRALDILNNDKFSDAYGFFSDYIVNINSGVVWADQDFKSAGHFYSPSMKRGLFGNRDALSLAVEYYNQALRSWRFGDNEDAMFYLGAAVHLVQDMTVPQHANIKLLDSHRQYENYIKRTCFYTPQFVVTSGGCYLQSIEEYIHHNARNAISIYNRLKSIDDENRRYYTITKFILPLAQKTTAGCFMMFYKDTAKIRSHG